MDGYRGRDYYTADEFKDGCSFNYWFGAAMGVIGTILASGVTVLVYMWAKNII
jgi:hypothetical protein